MFFKEIRFTISLKNRPKLLFVNDLRLGGKNREADFSPPK